MSKVYTVEPVIKPACGFGVYEENLDAHDKTLLCICHKKEVAQRLVSVLQMDDKLHYR